ncbi:hypothetical protein BABINDRAFT_9196 [Babjeviella inositovora NRRL Y-12698]|uniref:Uncharacterized protein n=1 Tax=Babjeviella inositovora NRRL Y-12698 TaxID=984486 RepID=A0A1E3QN40_9ASCO|nr:uncharacterized protein BABINDRAFT_9196 [Babjeviella inositovora NRRL Y-12698]ODQ78407.1 hypothetical protein BABINDRAFT_9196 [Babjeviella inositovora NRRL Y-12698]
MASSISSYSVQSSRGYSAATSITELDSIASALSPRETNSFPDTKTWRSYLSSPHNFHLQPIESVFELKIKVHNRELVFKQSDTISGLVELAKPISNTRSSTTIDSIKVFLEGHISLNDPPYTRMFTQEENSLVSEVQFPHELNVDKTLSVPFQFLVPETISESLPCGEILHQRLPPTSGNTSSCGYLFNNSPLENTYNYILNLQDQNICVTYFIKVLVTGKKDTTVDSSDLLLVLRRQVKILPSYSAPSPYWSPSNLRKFDNKLYYGALKYFVSNSDEVFFEASTGMTNRDKLMVSQVVNIDEFDRFDIKIPIPKPIRVNRNRTGKSFPLEILLPSGREGIPEYDSITVKLFQNVLFSQHDTVPANSCIASQVDDRSDEPHLIIDSKVDKDCIKEEKYEYLPVYSDEDLMTSLSGSSASLTALQKLITVNIPSSKITSLKLPPTFHTCQISTTYFLEVTFHFTSAPKDASDESGTRSKGSFFQKMSKFNFPGTPKAVTSHSIGINVPVVLVPEWDDCPDWAFTDDELLYGYALNEALPTYEANR